MILFDSVAPHPHHGPGHPEQRDHEQPHGLPGPSQHGQEAGLGCTVYCTAVL